jgi:hypothetical protein
MSKIYAIKCRNYLKSLEIFCRHCTQIGIHIFKSTGIIYAQLKMLGTNSEGYLGKKKAMSEGSPAGETGAATPKL